MKGDFKFSEDVKDGSLVRRHGNYIIPCDSKNKSMGVYRRAHREITKMYDLHGNRIEVIKDFPAGIAYWGPVIINSEKGTD